MVTLATDATLGLTNLDDEITVDELELEGELPQWLGGSLLRTGPARWDLGEQTVNHWFDGLAMLHRFTITPAGEAALDAWLADPQAPTPELRDVALIKVFFGADPRPIAEARLAYHEAMLANYEQLHADLAKGPPEPHGPISTLDAGIRHERAMAAYWRELL